jgi:hypothetical protein
MDENRFWDIIDSASAEANGSRDRQLEELERLLATFSPDDVYAFQQLFKSFVRRAYTWELWGAAYVIHGGCSDANFDYFRSWLISRGRERYERSMRDPDSLAELALDPDGIFFESFAYVARRVYESKAGHRMPLNPSPRAAQPSGVEWDDDPQTLSRLYPRLSARYSRQA